MTREEAIELLKSEKNRFSHKFQPYDVETRERWQGAYDMAIKALEQMPCEDATNGKVLLQMFPPSVYFGDDEKHIVLLTKDCELTCYNNEWWNAPYKVESEEKA